MVATTAQALVWRGWVDVTESVTMVNDYEECIEVE